MNKRLRLIGALASLLALSAYFAESVWASTCPPDATAEHSAAHHGGADAPPVAAMTPSSGSQHGDGPAHGAHVPADAQDAGTPLCPFGMAGPGSCVSASLAAATTESRFAAAVAGLNIDMPGDHEDLLITAALFHPPRP
jgi:hypothetical protein